MRRSHKPISDTPRIPGLRRTKMSRTPTLLIAALAALAAAASAPACAQDVVLGLNMVKSGVLKNVGEATETSVDIAVGEINAQGGIGGKKIKLVKFDTGSDPK